MAGRVTDGKFILNGEEFRLAQNSGRNAVHGGIEVIKIACKDIAAREVLCFIAKHFFSLFRVLTRNIGKGQLFLTVRFASLTYHLTKKRVILETSLSPLCLL